MRLERIEDISSHWRRSQIPLLKIHLLTADNTGSADSNHAVHISLVVPSAGGPRALHTFNPAMTYSVFGEDERIFGYQGLKINLRFNASDMRPGLQIQYTKRFKQIGETAPTDLKELLEPYLSKSTYILARNETLC